MVSARRTMSSAPCVDQNLTIVRPPRNVNVRTRTGPMPDTAIATVPTGFCSEPPPGPAMPVIADAYAGAQSARECRPP